VLAYSFDDDDWGTRRSVDDMMQSYPNLERRHVIPAEVGMEKIGHFGFFRPNAKPLWDKPLNWLQAHT
jgi:predicted alpha/beta hydrolase